MSNSSYNRAKDEFFVAAQVRPATAEHYIAWLEAYMDAGGRVDSLTKGSFAEAKFFTMSADAKIPYLDGERIINIIVPPGVKANAENVGAASVYFADGATKNRNASAPVWLEMLDTLIGDGYKMSQLVYEYDIRNYIQAAIVDRVTCGQAVGGDFYQTFSGLSFGAIDAGLRNFRDVPAESLLRDIMKLKPETAVDAETQKIIDQYKMDALKVLEMLHYRLNPESQQPIAVFGKRAKPAAPAAPEDPDEGLPDNIQVGPPLRLKEPDAPG